MGLIELIVTVCALSLPRPCTHKSGRPHRARQLPPLAPSKLRCIFSTS